MIETAKKMQIFIAREARIKSKIGAGVIAKLPPNRCGIAGHVMASEGGSAARGQQQSGQDAQQRGFPRSIRAKKGHSFTLFHLYADAAKRGRSRSCEGLQERAPTGTNRRVRFLQRFDANRVVGHSRVYNVSVKRKQCAVQGGSRHMTAKALPR